MYRVACVIVYFNSRPSARGDAQAFALLAAVFQFQFTPLREGRRVNFYPLLLKYAFQFTPLREGRPVEIEIINNSTFEFQFTPLREGRLFANSSSCASTNFNSRPSARGDIIPLLCRYHPLHFNSRPSARGDGKRYAISANLLFNPYKSAWLNNSATQFVEIILVIFHRIIA